MPRPSIYGEKPDSGECSFSLESIKRSILNATAHSFGQIIERIGFISDTFYMLKEMSFIGQMSGTSAVTPPVYVRLMWIEENPGLQFDKTNNGHILQLIDLYLQINQDWRQDPLISKCLEIPNFLNVDYLNGYSLSFISTHA